MFYQIILWSFQCNRNVHASIPFHIFAVIMKKASLTYFPKNSLDNWFLSWTIFRYYIKHKTKIHYLCKCCTSLLNCLLMKEAYSEPYQKMELKLKLRSKIDFYKILYFILLNSNRYIRNDFPK